MTRIVFQLGEPFSRWRGWRASAGSDQPATAATISFKVPLTGTEQVPPVTTAGKGNADLTWDPGTRVVTWDITDSGLTGPVTMAHFHDGPEGEEWTSCDLAHEERHRGHRPDQGRSDFDTGTGKAVRGWRLVHQRSH